MGEAALAVEASSNKVNVVSSTTKGLLFQIENLESKITTEIPELDAKVSLPSPPAGIVAFYILTSYVSYACMIC